MGTCCSLKHRPTCFDKPPAHGQCRLCREKTLLYIDNEEDNLDIFELVLEQKWRENGWGAPPPLKTVKNPLTAIHLVKDHPSKFPIIICDYSMPELNGVDTCRVIHKINPAVRLCVLSAYTSNTVETGLKKLPLSIFTKPDEMKTLFQTIRENF